MNVEKITYIRPKNYQKKKLSVEWSGLKIFIFSESHRKLRDIDQRKKS